tara:strand:- start:2116 stop:2592 length:477 start_codon:yes stop_codon:yes gene_type:complete
MMITRTSALTAKRTFTSLLYQFQYISIIPRSITLSRWNSVIPICNEYPMSKLFFKGRIETRQNHVLAGYNVNRDVKAGTEESPIAVMVQTEARKAEVEALAANSAIFVNITVDANKEENTLELDTLLNKPKTMTFEKTPNRNDPCSCGSGKKYKKCCA